MGAGTDMNKQEGTSKILECSDLRSNLNLEQKSRNDECVDG